MMPVIQRFPNCRVVINARDHAPPHFHVRMNDGREVWVDIETLEILSGRVSMREISDVLAWAGAHRKMLLEKFEDLQR